MKIMEMMRNKIRSFLQISPPSTQITIQQRLDYNANAIKNRIWYRGSSQELSELYSQLDVPLTMFWRATCTKGREIRKIHTGLPALMVRTLTNIIINDFNGIEFTDNDVLAEIWENIYKENKGDKLLSKCIKNMLVVGDGAFKISFDREISNENPIIEFYPGEYVEYIRRRGRITEVVFITEYINNRHKYTLKEHYGYGCIKYHLYNESGVEIAVNSIPQTEWIDSDISFDNRIILAVPCIFGNSEQYEGRGENIFDGKIDSFDALDEAWSQWMDALRAGRSKEYIPESLLPRNPNNGSIVIPPNSFDNRYIAIGDDMSEQAQNRITLEQATIPHESYLSTYITALDLCLQGIISPSTLGIDVKKMDNAEAQREKEKTTLYTRGNLIQFVEEIMPQLVVAAVCGYQIWNGLDVEIPKVTVSFGEYANPSFEAVVETVGKAKTQGIMSIEASVDELYGDSKDTDWKAKEIARLKAEQGIQEFEEPTVNTEIEGFKVGF